MPARAASDTGLRCSNIVVGQHSQTKLWEDMLVSLRLMLRQAKTAQATYAQRMQRNREWVDTAFVHALACAVGVTILVFQEGVDPTIIGTHLIDVDDGDCDLVVPVALANEYHFWVVVKSAFP